MLMFTLTFINLIIFYSESNSHCGYMESLDPPICRRLKKYLWVIKMDKLTREIN